MGEAVLLFQFTPDRQFDFDRPGATDTIRALIRAMKFCRANASQTRVW
jgi:hypothetical protein